MTTNNPFKDLRKKFIVFDTETEGTNLFTNRPWQCAWSVYENGHMGRFENHYIWWDDLNISKGAKRQTGFNYQEYKQNAEDASTVLDLFEKDVKQCPFIVGHNVLGFDTMIVNTWRRSLGRRSHFDDINKYIDTLALERGIQSDLPFDFENPLAWQLKMINLRTRKIKATVAALIKKYNISIDEGALHDAAIDIVATGEIFKQQSYILEV